MKLDWFLGTMGYGYKDWQGVFYPAGSKPPSYLPYYSQRFNAVEMDTTFYGTPRRETVRKWADSVPAGFKFCPKTPRQLTHDRGFVDTGREMADFLDTMRLFGDKLGPTLIQFPPDYTISQIENLAISLPELPTDLRYAVEFRHRSWHSRATGELLQKHNICWVSAEYLYLPQRVYVTTDFLYIRWLGKHGTYTEKTHEREDKTPRLQVWHDDIQNRADGSFDTVYGFFNNDYAGYSPATCNKFKQIAGLPTHSITPPQQGRLF